MNIFVNKNINIKIYNKKKDIGNIFQKNRNIYVLAINGYIWNYIISNYKRLIDIILQKIVNPLEFKIIKCVAHNFMTININNILWSYNKIFGTTLKQSMYFVVIKLLLF